MAAGIPVNLGHVSFRTKGEATKHFKAMLNRYSIGQRVSPDDSVDLAALLLRHNSYQEKIGAGVDHFVVMDDGHNYKCFGVLRVDGSIEDFTYRRCITQIWD